MRSSLFISCIATAAISLAACQKTGAKNDWDHYDYQRIARDKIPVDNDAYYIPPVNPGCLDDAPSNSGYCQ